jgi:thiol-disulfide isomerase/thioredoxin
MPKRGEPVKVAERVPLKKEDLNTIMTFKDFDNGANLFVMMFNPTCSHCEDMTVMFEKNMALFKKTKIVLLATMMMKDYLPDFVNMLHVQDYPFIKAGLDSSGFINNVFLYQTLPQINIYNAERRLLKTYAGEVPMDTLKKYIE